MRLVYCYIENNKDIFLELIHKRELYPYSYIDEFMKNYSEKIFSSNKFIRLIICVCINDED